VIPLAEARRHVLQACPPRPPAEVALDDALGLVLAADVAAAEDVPPFANTAVDGYAVVAADTAAVPVELPVVATLAAGGHRTEVLAPGTAVRLMTGAPLPPGADAVVMVEDTERAGTGGADVVRIRRGVAAGDAVRPAGSDVRRGDVVLRAGTELRPAHLGVLASIGRRRVPAVPRLRVGVLSTGDELVEGDAPLGPGQIRESNKTMLLACVARADAEAVDLGVVRDDEPTLEAVLRDAAQRCDALVTSGGVSMGDYDVVKAVLSRLADMRWMQIALKPAKPFAFGVLDAGGDRRVPVFGLPGNPVSSLVSFELLARPALRRMAGHGDDDLERVRVRAVADDGLRRRPDGKLHVVRVHGRFADDGRWHVRSSGEQGSHQLAATAAAHGLALVADGDGVPAGAEVDVLLLT
jgi:molybdenum cofactor synthesis domain-containing protein